MTVTNELVAAVRAHAVKHYEEGGWDYVVEAMTDADIAERIGKARTVNGAITKVATLVHLWDGQRREVMATAF